MRASVTFALALALTGCGGGDPTNPGGGSNGVTNFTAEIDGVDWNPDVAPSANNVSPGRYVITAVRTTGANPLQLLLYLYNISGTGTYPLGVTNQVFGGWAQVVGPQYSNSSWSTQPSGAAGEITISVLSATQIVGTFSFVAHPQGGTIASGLRTVA